MRHYTSPQSPREVYLLKTAGKSLFKYEELREIVYTLLSMVPVGKVVSYKDLALIVGVSPRLIGRMLRENEKPIIIPCHRVVKSDGSLGGYSGFGGSAFKRKLLELEGVEFVKGKIRKSYFWDGLYKILGE